MGFSSLKSVGSISNPSPPFAGTKQPSIKTPTELKVVNTPLQVRRSERIQEQKPPSVTSLTVSRRDAMLTAVSLAASSLLWTESAEARIVNPEIRRTIFEKLQMIREKFGLSKPEDKSTTKDSPSPPWSSSAAKEKAKEQSKKETPHAPIFPGSQTWVKMFLVGLRISFDTAIPLFLLSQKLKLVFTAFVEALRSVRK